MKRIEMIGVEGMGEVRAGACVGELICAACARQGIKLADDDVAHIIPIKEIYRHLLKRSIVKILDLVRPLPDIGIVSGALLALVPVPAHHAGQAGINGEACTPAIFGTICLDDHR